MIQKKICMVGPVSVGKTSMIARYVHSVFSEKYLSTVGVKIDKKTLSVDGRGVTLMLWDLAGDDDFQRLKMSCLRGAAGYLLIVDGTRRATLEKAADIQKRVTKSVGSIPFVLVLNKTDLAEEWELEPSDVASFTARGWTVRRTSAKRGSSVEEVFSELVRAILAREGLKAVMAEPE